MVFSKQEIAKIKGEGKYCIIEGSNVRRTLRNFVILFMFIIMLI